MWIFTPEKDISCCTITPNGRAIIYGFVGEKKLNLVVRGESDKNEEENRKETQMYIEEMCSKIIPYGDKELSGQITTLI